MTARGLATDLVNAVLLHGRSLTVALDGVRRRHDPRLLATAQDLAYGVLRHYGRLHFQLRQLAGRPPEPPELAGLLLVALFELGNRDTPAYAVVNEAVAQAGQRLPRTRGFVNAVLRSYLRRRDELEGEAGLPPEARWDFPGWWIDRLREQYPDGWETLLATLNGHPPMTLRVNRRRVGMADYQSRLDAAGIAWRRTGDWALTLVQPMRAADLPGFAAGLVSVQDLGAQSACPLLDCRGGMRVLDACAAPGGKTAHLLEAHDLELLALDADPSRLARVADNLARLGLGATLLAADAGNPTAWWDGRPFQRILLDAPCTASGVVRRHPDGKWLKRCEDVTALADQQARLLDAVWPLLEQGGKLLYATCSLFRQENGDQVEAFLRRHADARQAPPPHPELRAGQLLPDGDHDGFFYACLHKA
jgi:16S rRNA (cytosine967-C5)-methyltransferase